MNEAWHDRIDRWRERIEPIRYRLLFAALLMLTVVYPVLPRRFFDGRVLNLSLLLILLVAIATASRHRRHVFTVLGLLAAPGVLATLADTVVASPGLQLSMLAFDMLFFGGLAAVLLNDVARTPRANPDTLFGAVSAYLAMGIFWSLAYALILYFDAGAIRLAPSEDDFRSPAVIGELLYFSFVTLTTLGYGDVAPLSPLARTVAWTEAATGQMFLAILVARLVALQVTSERLGDS